MFFYKYSHTTPHQKRFPSKNILKVYLYIHRQSKKFFYSCTFKITFKIQIDLKCILHFLLFNPLYHPNEKNANFFTQILSHILIK